MVELTRQVRRRVATLRGQALVLTLAPDGIWLREPRRRTAYLLPYGHAFLEAVRLHVAAERRRKLEARKLAARRARG